MQKFVRDVIWRNLHQSWMVVALCAGVVAGVILGVALRVNYFASPVWLVLVVGLLVVAYIKPKCAFVVLALVAGMVLAFFRVAGELAEQEALGEAYKVTAGLETEEWVVGVRDWFAGRIRGLIGEPEVSLGLSYLLGMKSGLPKDISESLRAVGLTHIVVASGAHLSILVEVARKIFGKLSRFAGLLFSGVFVVFFMAMVGWTPSIMRAGIMTILTLVAWYVGRKFEPWRIILLVAAVTLMMNPMSVTNLGWQLSFAAYGGIMLLGPGWVKFFYGARRPGLIGSTVITTLAATVMTLPIILYYFGAVSLISVVANLLILPTLPWAMGLVFMTGVLAEVPLLGEGVGWCATRLLDFHIAVVGWFGGMRQFLVEIPPYQGWVWALYVSVAVMLVVGWWQKRKRREVVKAEEEGSGQGRGKVVK